VGVLLDARVALGVTTARVRWLLWIVVIVAIVVPWRDFQHHTHWGKVVWIPFVSLPWRISDAIANVLLYMPFGYLYPRQSRRQRAGWRTIVLAAVLSLSTEYAQLYSHSRFPSLTDVTCNLLGAYVGLHVANLRHRNAGDPVRR
jgi:glycopeptide antibiotics resistance protein